MMKLSTATCNGMLKDKGFKEQFENGVIELYSGPQPVNADAAVQGLLLGLVTQDGGTFVPGNPTNGLSFDDPVNKVIQKAAAEDWEMTGLNVGTIGWGRLKGNVADLGAGADTTHSRVDFSVGISGADLNLANITIAIGTPVTINTFALTLPSE